LFPLYRLRRHIRNHASSIFSLAESYLRRAVADVSGACAALHTAVIFNGIDVQRLRDVGTTGPLVCEAKHLGEKAAGELWAVFSGSLGKTYDIRTMAAAAELLASWNRKIRIIITGAGPLAEFLRGAQQALGERRLLYLGTIGNEDLYRLYMRCDIGLCAYGAESNVAMPDKAYDYLAAGLVVVNSLKGELEGRVCDRELGIAYRAGDAASLAKALCYLADNPEMRVRMRENSYAAALEFDQARQFPKIVSLVEKVTSPKSPVTGEGVAPGPASGPNPAKAIGRVGGTPQL
jgi:glycosyltransferase involved in cell wall biosynthesis